MTRPLLATKLWVPTLRHGLLARPRLLARMDGAAGARLTLISAPAGFGKTTILAAWLHRPAPESRRVAWLSLDAADNEPASFWTYLVAAVQAAGPGVGGDALELLASSASVELVLTTLLNELSATPDDVWLVLDDYHLVDHQEISQGMIFLLEHLPPNFHVVLSTRANPDLPLPRWRARGELVEIRAADLRFTHAETTAYLTGAIGQELAAGDVEILEERTEGWIAALQLAALSLRGRQDVSGFITRFAGDDRYIVDYLMEEVLTHQPDTVRTFLLRTAVLDRLTGPLCDAVTGRQDGSQMILTLDRANLFLVALDDRREWFRYHHLFADVLRARLLNERPEEVPLLHRRASQWYEHHESPEEAVTHAVAARDFDRAARLMELAVSVIRRHRQESTMHGWLRELPEDTVRRSPMLSLFYGSMLLAAGELGAVEPWLADAERALAAAADGLAHTWADTDEMRTLPSTIAMYRAALAQARGDAAGTAHHARRALDLAGPEDHLARGGAAGFLGFAAWAQGDVTKALETFTQAVASLHAAGSLVDELTGTVVLGDLYLVAGRPSQARRVCTRALERAEEHGARVARAIAELHVALGELDVGSGDLEAAERHLAAAATITDQAGMNEGRFRWFVAQALVIRAQGDPEAALSFLDQAEKLYRPGFYPQVRPIAALKARIWIEQGKLADAAEWARACGVTTADDAYYQSEFDHLTLVRLLLAQHRAMRDADALAQATALLDRLSRAAETAGRAGSLLELRVLHALVCDAQGRRPEALEQLARALRLAPEPDSYVRLFLDEGAPMQSLLRAATLANLVGDPMRRLLSPVAQAANSTRRVARSTAETLSERELQVLRLLDSELTAPQIARELFVSHNTVRTHTKHIFTKLDVTTRRAAVLRAREHGLL